MLAEMSVSDGIARISNGLIELETSIGGQMRLRTLRNLNTGTDWVPPAPEYQWGTDDHFASAGYDRECLWPDLSPRSFEFLALCSRPGDDAPTELTGLSVLSLDPAASSADADDTVARLELAALLPEWDVRITVVTHLHAGLPIIRRWATIDNLGEEPLRLHRLLSMVYSLRPSYADLDLYWLEAFKHTHMLWRQMTMHRERISASVRRRILYGADERHHDGSSGAMGWLALHEPHLGEGLFAGWEWTGPFDVEIGDFREGAGAFGLRAGFSDERGYSRLLEPGERFEAPGAFVGLFEGDIEQAGRVTADVAEAVFALPWPEGKAPILVGYDTWNNWEDYTGNTGHLKPERIDEEVRIAADLGVELFILDYDWFPLLGEWESDLTRLPRGVEGVSAAVKAAGMRFGIWMGFGQAHPDSRVVKDHPEWLAARNGQTVIGGWGMHQLAFGYPPCREWVLAQVSRVIEDFGVDWLKHDFNLINISDSKLHAPNSTDDRIEAVRGYYWIMEQLHVRFPDLYLDNWTPPTGGADFGNISRHHSSLMADWYTPITIRSAFDGIRHLLRPERTHCYLRAFTQQEERDPYQYRSAFFGNGVCLLNDITRWDARTVQVVKAEIERMKQDRELFRGGQVYSLIPRQPDHFGWEARLVYNADLGAGMAQVFRNHDDADSNRIVLRGLEPDRAYSVTIDEEACPGPLAGRELTGHGITVRLAQPFSCCSLRLRRI